MNEALESAEKAPPSYYATRRAWGNRAYAVRSGDRVVKLRPSYMLSDGAWELDAADMAALDWVIADFGDYD